MVDDIKKTAVKVKLMLANVILIEKPHQRGDVQARDQSKQDAAATLCTRNQGKAMQMVYTCHFKHNTIEDHDLKFSFHHMTRTRRSLTPI
jgi:hypothetical protein